MRLSDSGWKGRDEPDSRELSARHFGGGGDKPEEGHGWPLLSKGYVSLTELGNRVSVGVSSRAYYSRTPVGVNNACVMALHKYSGEMKKCA